MSDRSDKALTRTSDLLIFKPVKASQNSFRNLLKMPLTSGKEHLVQPDPSLPEPLPVKGL
jgi:hypothetical protein